MQTQPCAACAHTICIAATIVCNFSEEKTLASVPKGHATVALSHHIRAFVMTPSCSSAQPCGSKLQPGLFDGWQRACSSCTYTSHLCHGLWELFWTILH